MVIVATYLLFISGSVMLCKLLQKNKRYYYKKNHFVSVSSMAYRMKRNGAGLASICILSTMVLVMMMGAGSLYFGIRMLSEYRPEVIRRLVKKVRVYGGGRIEIDLLSNDDFILDILESVRQMAG